MSHDDGGAATEQFEAEDLSRLFENADADSIAESNPDDDTDVTIDVDDIAVDTVSTTGSGIDTPEEIVIDVLVTLSDRSGRYRTTATFDIEDETATLTTVAGEGTFGLQVIATREAERRVTSHEHVSAVVGLENYLQSHPAE